MQIQPENFLTVEDIANTPRSNGSAVRSALLAEVLRGSGHVRRDVRLRVHGESMLPALWPGDVVEIASCSLEDLRPGEIVLALREDRLFLHRLIAPCTPDGFRLRGDSMPGYDPQYPPEALLGRLVPSVRHGRGRSSAVLSRALGMLFCYSAAARRLALKLHGWRAVSAGAARNQFRNSETI